MRACNLSIKNSITIAAKDSVAKQSAYAERIQPLEDISLLVIKPEKDENLKFELDRIANQINIDFRSAQTNSEMARVIKNTSNESLPEYYIEVNPSDKLVSLYEIETLKAKLASDTLTELDRNMSESRLSDLEYFVESTQSEKFDPADFSSVMAEQEKFEDVKILDDSIKANKGVELLTQKLESKFGVKSEFITEEEAFELTSGRYDGESGFFFNDKVYLISNKATKDTAVHEYMHPVVAIIAKNNPKLFNRFVEQALLLEGSRELFETVANTYADLSPDAMKQEFLVRVITAQSKLQDSANDSFLRNVIYQLKQILKSVFGNTKLNLDNLNSNTSLDEFIKLLETTGEFELNLEGVTQEDFIAYQKELNEITDSFAKLTDNDLNSITNNAFNIASGQVDKLLRNKNYAELFELLKDDFGNDTIELIKNDLAKYKDIIFKKAEDKKRYMAMEKDHLIALSNTFAAVEDMYSKIEAHAKELAKDENNVENLHKVIAYRRFMDHWGTFIDDVYESLRSNPDIGKNNPLMNRVESLRTTIDNIERSFSEINKKGSRDAIFEVVSDMSKNIDDYYKDLIDSLIKKGAPQKVIDKWFKQYHGLNREDYNTYTQLKERESTTRLHSYEKELLTRLELTTLKDGVKITKEKIEALLEGKLGDTNAVSAYLEGYLYSPDLVVGGLAKFMKDKLNEVNVKALAKYNSFLNDIQEDLKAIGYNPSRVSDLGDKFYYLDTVGENKDGKIQEKKIWKFLNPFKDYEHALAVERQKVEDAKRKFENDKTEEAKKEYYDTKKKFDKWFRTYFTQPYADGVYAIEDIFEKFPGDEIGRKAKEKKDAIFAEIERLNGAEGTLMTNEERQALINQAWQEYNKLFSLYDPTTFKLKSKEDLAIRDRLIEYREARKKYWETVPKKGAFEKAYITYRNYLVNEQGLSGELLEYELEEWVKSNTVRKIKPEYYAKRKSITEQIKALRAKLSTISKQDDSTDTTENYKIINDLKSIYKDEEGIVSGMSMPEDVIKEIKKQQEIIQQKNKKRFSFLSEEESEEYDKLRTLVSQADEGIIPDLTDDEYMRYKELKSKFPQTTAEEKIIKSKIDTLNSQLKAMERTYYTGEYLSTLSNFLDQIDDEDNEKLNTIKKNFVVNNKNVDLLHSGNGRDVLFEILGAKDEDGKLKYPEFLNWYKKNHIDKKVKDGYTSSPILAWTYTEPANKDLYFEVTEVKDPSGTTHKVYGSPMSRQFTESKVKPEFVNNRLVGIHIDNRGKDLYNALPRLDVPNSPFINEEYFRMKNSNPAEFKLLQKLTKHHLANQEGLGKGKKLFLEAPRYPQEGLETWQSKDVVEKKYNALTQWAKRTKEFFYGSSFDQEKGMNPSQTWSAVRLDSIDQEYTDVPITGMYDMDHSDVSKNVLTNMMRYMHSVERHKVLLELNPVAQAIKATLSDPEHSIKEVNKIDKGLLTNRNLIRFKSKGGTNYRKTAVSNMIEREIEGVNVKGFGANSAWIFNMQRILLGRASFQFFALNVPSSLKNMFGAKFQGGIEASAGKHFNHADMAFGEAWATKTMFEVSNSIYAKGPKPLNVQLSEIMNFSAGRTDEKFGQSVSRSLLKDSVEGSWLYSIRKWTELQPTFQISAAMMNKKKVKITQNGIDTFVKFHEIWHLVDGQIQTKPGVDPTYALTFDESGNMVMGKNLRKFITKIEQVNRNLQGAYDSFSQPEAQRYVMFRFISYLRKYFTTQFISRWGYSGSFKNPIGRYNVGLEEPSIGFYVEALYGVKELFTTYKLNLAYMTDSQKQAVMKFTTELVFMLVISLLIPYLLGWDPEDKEKYKKLKAKSGPLPLPFVPEDPNRPFQLGGWLENHALYLAMNIRAENEQFVPYTTQGIGSYIENFSFKSIAFGPTIDLYKTFIDDIILLATGDDRAYYKRDVGAYAWQKKKGSKFIAHLAKLAALTGSSVEPSTAIENFQSIAATGRK